MKLVTNREALIAALDRAGSSVEPKHNVMRHVFLSLSGDVLELVGSCAAGEMRCSVGVEPGCESGAVLVDPRTLLAAVRAIPGDVVRLTETKAKLTVDSPKVKGRAVKGIGVLDASEFPPRRALADGAPVPAAPFLRGVRAVKAFASLDDQRPHLASVYADATAEDTHAVATNGNALAVYCCGAVLGRSVLIPGPALAIVTALDATTLAVSTAEPAFATFAGEGWSYTNAPLGPEARFPSWRQVVPNDPPVATLECATAELSKAIADAMAVCPASKSIVIAVTHEGASVETERHAEPSFATDLGGKVTGKVRTATNGKQLRDALAQCGGSARVTMLGSIDPMRVDSGAEFFAIIMPWREAP